MDQVLPSQKVILFIEDDEFLQTMYRQTLENQGYRVIRAQNGEIGIALAKENKPHIIILDLMLPGNLSGFDVLQEIRSDDSVKSIPIIVFSNLENEEEKARNLGANDFLVKVRTPIPNLVDMINKHLHMNA